MNLVVLNKTFSTIPGSSETLNKKRKKKKNSCPSTNLVLSYWGLSFLQSLPGYDTFILRYFKFTGHSNRLRRCLSLYNCDHVSVRRKGPIPGSSLKDGSP